MRPRKNIASTSPSIPASLSNSTIPTASLPCSRPSNCTSTAKAPTTKAYRTLGAHPGRCEGDVAGVRFAVWAPNAEVVSVIGDFNGWDRTRHPMRLRDGGIWEIFIPALGPGAHYKYSVPLHATAKSKSKCDPYGFFAEVPPQTASIVWELTNYTWDDEDWMTDRAHRNLAARTRLHLRSASRIVDARPRATSPLTYRELADQLVAYVDATWATRISN